MEFPFLFNLMERRNKSVDMVYEKKIIKADVLEGKSLYLFDKDHKVRKYAFIVAKNYKFEAFIIICIIISTCSLSYQSPLNDPNSKVMQFWGKVDTITTVIFTFECALKIVALGFVSCGKLSYMRNIANVFDFIIVVSALINAAQGEGASKSLNIFKVLRIARIARPLRIISRSEGLTIAINSLGKSFPNMINLFFFCFLIFFLFGIFGVNYFKGCFYICDYTHIPKYLWPQVDTMQECMDYGGDWLRGDTNFDNIGFGLSAMFKISMTEGWLDIMKQGVNSRFEKVPVPLNAPYW